jgi:hypothetical protein
VTIKPMRAENYDPNKIKFPVWEEPKIDGFRGYNPDGLLLARTLKKHANRYVTAFFSKPEYKGFDGELAAQHETHPDLCRLTTSALNTEAGEPFVLWHIFDYVTEETRRMPYWQRYTIMADRIREFQSKGMCGQLRIVPYRVCNNLEELMQAHQENMEAGYEGTCFYGPDVAHKEGKSSPRHNGVLRIKDFIDTEALVLGLVEGEKNLNEATINELGRQVRSSHQENKVPNGMVGSLQCQALEDVRDLYSGKLLLEKDQKFICSPGAMTEDEKIDFFCNPHKIVNHIIKLKFFPKGVKDKPRFPNYMMIRPKVDIL